MGRGIQLARVYGIRILLDWSMLFIVVLVSFNLGAGLLPRWHPDWSVVLRYAVGLAAAALLLVSILLHELAHAVVAKRNGVPVSSITLFLFGGVANIEREPPSARVEFWMAVVGPVVSALLGIGFLMVGSVLAGRSAGDTDDPETILRSLGPVATLLMWLGPVNLSLALFNLLPGFPLDGGRVLRAVLWRVTGNLQSATRWAAGVGRGFGMGFVLAGIAMLFGAWFPLLGGGPVQGVWIAMIGWLLMGAAGSSYQQLVVESVLEGVPVRRLMQRNVTTVQPILPLVEFVDRHLMRSDERAFPVMDADRLAGIICLEDVRRVPRVEWPVTSVANVMTPAEKLATVEPETDAWTAVRTLSKAGVGQLPVLQDGALVGMLRMRDVLRWIELQSDVRGGPGTVGMRPDVRTA